MPLRPGRCWPQPGLFRQLPGHRQPLHRLPHPLRRRRLSGYRRPLPGHWQPLRPWPGRPAGRRPECRLCRLPSDSVLPPPCRGCRVLRPGRRWNCGCPRRRPDRWSSPVGPGQSPERRFCRWSRSGDSRWPPRAHPAGRRPAAEGTLCRGGKPPEPSGPPSPRLGSPAAVHCHGCLQCPDRWSCLPGNWRNNQTAQWNGYSYINHLL